MSNRRRHHTPALEALEDSADEQSGDDRTTMSGGGDIQDGEDDTDVDGRNSEEDEEDDEDEGRNSTTLLDSRHVGIPPAPVVCRPKKLPDGTWELALRSEPVGLYTFSTEGGTFTCSHNHKPTSKHDSCDGSCAALAWFGVIYVHKLKAFASGQFSRILGRVELEKLIESSGQLVNCLLFKTTAVSRKAERNANVQAILNHIFQAFPDLLNNFDLIVENALDVTLNEPVPYLQKPELTAQCPYACGCWFRTKKAWNQHTNPYRLSPYCPRTVKQNQTRKVGDWGEERYSQSLSMAPAEIRKRVLLRKEYTPTNPSSSHEVRFIPSQDPHTQIFQPAGYIKRGWDFLVHIRCRFTLSPAEQRKEKGLDPKFLMDLVAAPEKRLKGHKYSPGSQEWRRESALILIRSWANIYWRHADLMLGQTFGFTKKLKKIAALNWKRALTDGSYHNYVRAITTVFSFVLRWSATPGLSDIIEVGMDEDLTEAFEKLQKLIYTGEQKLTIEMLSPLLHAVLVCLLRSKDEIVTARLSLVEIVLVLTSLRDPEKGYFCHNSVITGNCAHFTRLCSVTLLSAALSGGWEKPYALPDQRVKDKGSESESGDSESEGGDRGGDSEIGDSEDENEESEDEDDENEDDEDEGDEDEDDEDEDDEDEDDEDEDDEDEEEEEVAEEEVVVDEAAVDEELVDNDQEANRDEESRDGDSCSDTRFEPSLRNQVKVVGPQSEKARLIEEMMMEVMSKDDTLSPNLYHSVTRFWSEADNGSRTAKGNRTFIVDQDRLGFTYKPDKNTTLSFKLADFGTCYRYEIHELRKALELLVPASILSTVWESFQLSGLEDDVDSPESLFSQNADYFGTFVTRLRAVLFSQESAILFRKNLLSRKKVAKYLADHEAFQRTLMKVLYVSLGIPPRSFQAAELIYDSHGQLVRCLKIFDGIVILCNPVAKQNGSKQYECFWALRDEVAKYLLFFIGVIRPVVISLLEHPVINSVAPIPELRRFIFVSLRAGNHSFSLVAVKTKTFYCFKGTEIDSCLQETSLAMDLKDLRQVATGIMRNWFPELSQAYSGLNDPGVQAPMDRQGQHSRKVCNGFYAVDMYIRGTTFNRAECESQIRVSSAWQNLDIVVQNGGEAVTKPTINHVDAFARNGFRAMEAAKAHVYSKDGYDLLRSGSTVENISKRSQALIRSKPFLRNPMRPGEEWTKSWDTLGDQCTVKVTAALAHGYMLEDPKDISLRMGYSARIVACAVYCIASALDEWSTGNYTLKDWEGDPNREIIVQVIEKAILHFRRHHQEEWLAFRRKVDHLILRGDKQRREAPRFSQRPFLPINKFATEDSDSEDEETSRNSRQILDLEKIRSEEVAAEKRERQLQAEVEIAARHEANVEKQQEEAKKKKKKLQKERKEDRSAGGNVEEPKKKKRKAAPGDREGLSGTTGGKRRKLEVANENGKKRKADEEVSGSQSRKSRKAEVSGKKKGKDAGRSTTEKKLDAVLNDHN
ncbi:hypothetical protein VKT23_020580 [Stygiomarasmius scandens]|uniref:Uncharacterized protein n=1 Tax=Marasmiellus scandens TaxID=2682957 RepID=A0ABR1IJZ3_9AGAR